jgi:hypothetical protein
VFVKPNENVFAGNRIGLVGQVINPDKITINHPRYIQELAHNTRLSMLHLEVYTSYPEKSDKYSGGNWFGKNKPKDLCDPTIVLFEK